MNKGLSILIKYMWYVTQNKSFRSGLIDINEVYKPIDYLLDDIFVPLCWSDFILKLRKGMKIWHDKIISRIWKAKYKTCRSLCRNPGYGTFPGYVNYPGYGS